MTLFDYAGLNDLPLKAKKINNLNIGLPYKGCKRKIAHKLLQIMADECPQAKYFYDMFGGGGSMSLLAFGNGYHTIYNELSPVAYYYFDFVASQSQNKKGKYGILPDEFYQFVSKAEFDRVKAEHLAGKYSVYNSFVMYNYSFGNDLNSYFVSSDKEQFKRIGHYLMLDNDKECAEWWDNYFSKNGSVNGIYEYMHKHIYPSLTWQERRAYFVNITLKIEAIRVAGIKHLFKDGDFEALHKLSQKELCRIIDKHNPNLPKKTYKRQKILADKQEKLGRLKELREVKQLEHLQQLQQLQHLQQLQRLQRLERLERLQRLEQLERLNLSYNQVKITTPPSETIIYCDPPYWNTSGYHIKGFDYEAFYDWTKDMAMAGYNVFCSEYYMPEDRFEVIGVINTNTTMSGTNKKDVQEKLFKPRLN